jgi:hypothetical protein
LTTPLREIESHSCFPNLENVSIPIFSIFHGFNSPEKKYHSLNELLDEAWGASDSTAWSQELDEQHIKIHHIN